MLKNAQITYWKTGKGKWEKPKTIKTDLHHNIPIITLSVSGLHTPIKRQIGRMDLKKTKT